MKRINQSTPKQLHIPRFVAIFALFLGFGLMPLTFSSTAEAASCGGKNQKACPALKKGPQCSAWLAKDKRKICRPCGGFKQKACPVLKAGKVCKDGLKKKRGMCVVNDKKASRKFLKQITGLVKKNTSHVNALGDFHSCLKKKGRKRALRKAIKSKNSRAASRVINTCLTADIRRKLRAKPRGLSAGRNPNYFNTLSVGLGGGVIVGIGASGDSGVVISLNGSGLKFYTNREFSYGLGLSVGADMNAGISRQVLSAGTDRGRAIAASGRYIAGLGVAVDFSQHAFPKWNRFDGFTISGGLGGGAEIGTIYKSTARVF